jgi:hypothetical protein
MFERVHISRKQHSQNGISCGILHKEQIFCYFRNNVDNSFTVLSRRNGGVGG